MNEDTSCGSEATGHPPGSPGLVLVDIGNSRVALATWHGGARTKAEHLPNDPMEPVVSRIAQMWHRLAGTSPRALVVSSVSPTVLERVRAGCQAHGIESILVVGQDIPLPIAADVPEPAKVGTDRLCTAAAAFEQVRCACVVADFGTALTIDLVADNNTFLGGTIMPGMTLAASALHDHTAVLPRVEIGTPTETLGKDTASAIRNGIFAMMIGALREITERYATQIGKWPLLIVTGGDGGAVAQACDFVDRVVPDLCLDGLVLAYQRSTSQNPLSP